MAAKSSHRRGTTRVDDPPTNVGTTTRYLCTLTPRALTMPPVTTRGLLVRYALAVVWSQAWRRAITSRRARTPAGAQTLVVSFFAVMFGVAPLLLGLWLWWLLTGGGPVRWLGVQRYAIVNVTPRPSPKRLEQTMDAVREHLSPVAFDGEVVEGRTYKAPHDAPDDWAADALDAVGDRRAFLVLSGRRGFREGTVEHVDRAAGHVTLRTHDGVEYVRIAEIVAISVTP